MRLFEHLGEPIELESTRVVEALGDTHLGFRVLRRIDVRKVIVSEFVSLDGVMEDPAWTFRFSSEEQEQYKFAELAAADALLLGRVTYEEFAAAWPSMMEKVRRSSPGRTRRIRRDDERLPQACRLDDSSRAPRVEQLDADQR